MDKPFLGSGLSFPLAVGRDPATPAQFGRIVPAAYEDSVRQSLWIILSTAKGERAMRPDFGCGLHDLLFALNNDFTAARVAATVEDALSRFEPRIELIDVKVDRDLDGERLLIDIDYRVIATNNEFNLVYPFYLEGGGAE